MKILIINGPNLNLLGQREPGIYGSSSFDTYLPELRKRFADIDIEYYQSNVEGELINKMQEVGECWCIHSHLRRTPGLHPFAQDTCNRGTHLECTSARGVPSQVNDIMRLQGRYLRLWTRLIPFGH